MRTYGKYAYKQKNNYRHRNQNPPTRRRDLRHLGVRGGLNQEDRQHLRHEGRDAEKVKAPIQVPDAREARRAALQTHPDRPARPREEAHRERQALQEAGG